MKTKFKLFDGRKVTVEQTLTAIRAQYDGEAEVRNIDTLEYVHIVRTGVPIANIL